MLLFLDGCLRPNKIQKYPKKDYLSVFELSRQQDNEVKKGDTSLDERELHKKALGIVIRKVRKEYGWKQEEMEEYTNLSETMIGKLERGEREL
ncbi:helix-turn-helix domain-containing protein [Sutcliffiella horikoshii]|uniref:helix-turn-helix domain-containing protein n=1 Tax=Sutcliffiella horikoshii TaxID=79883 RepID=UPI00384DCC55